MPLTLLKIGGKMGIPPAMTGYHGTDENTFLGMVAAKAGTYKPLPATGTQVYAGEIYGYNGGLVIVRQSHIRTWEGGRECACIIQRLPQWRRRFDLGRQRVGNCTARGPGDHSYFARKSSHYFFLPINL